MTIQLTETENRILRDYTQRIELLTEARTAVIKAIISRTEAVVGPDEQINIFDGFLAVTPNRKD